MSRYESFCGFQIGLWFAKYSKNSSKTTIKDGYELSDLMEIRRFRTQVEILLEGLILLFLKVI